MHERAPSMVTAPLTQNGGPIDILVVEDNESERESIVSALQSAIADVRVLSVASGDEALDFLLGRGAWADRADLRPPSLVLLDLAMPGTDGFSLLAQIRSIEPRGALTLTPMVVFTDSHDVDDIHESYRCGANSYVIKPLSYADFQSVVTTVGQYWMGQNNVYIQSND